MAAQFRGREDWPKLLKLIEKDGAGFRLFSEVFFQGGNLQAPLHPCRRGDWPKPENQDGGVSFLRNQLVGILAAASGAYRCLFRQLWRC